jgi:hypothetical protein
LRKEGEAASPSGAVEEKNRNLRRRGEDGEKEEDKEEHLGRNLQARGFLREREAGMLGKDETNKTSQRLQVSTGRYCVWRSSKVIYVMLVH